MSVKMANHHRDIAAPFQPGGPMSPRGSLEAFQLDESCINYTYVGAQFPQLDSQDQLTYSRYCGPTPESNWVIPGRLLVGAYPASESDVETCDLLTAILTQGVTKFVCLQAEYRSEGITEAMWRHGNALRPYFEDVKLMLKNKTMFKQLSQVPNVVELNDVSFVHFPIKDCSVTDDTRVLQLALKLVAEIHRGEILYMHCWGGHGRTGTLVSIMLHLMYGLDSVKSMQRCQSVHDIRQCPVVVGSPQTQTQRDQVHRIITFLQRQVNQHILTQPTHPNTPNSTTANFDVIQVERCDKHIRHFFPESDNVNDMNKQSETREVVTTSQMSTHSTHPGTISGPPIDMVESVCQTNLVTIETHFGKENISSVQSTSVHNTTIHQHTSHGATTTVSTTSTTTTASTTSTVASPNTNDIRRASATDAISTNNSNNPSPPPSKTVSSLSSWKGSLKSLRCKPFGKQSNSVDNNVAKGMEPVKATTAAAAAQQLAASRNRSQSTGNTLPVVGMF